MVGEPGGTDSILKLCRSVLHPFLSKHQRQRPCKLSRQAVPIQNCFTGKVFLHNHLFQLCSMRCLLSSHHTPLRRDLFLLQTLFVSIERQLLGPTGAPPSPGWTLQFPQPLTMCCSTSWGPCAEPSFCYWRATNWAKNLGCNWTSTT